MNKKWGIIMANLMKQMLSLLGLDDDSEQTQEDLINLSNEKINQLESLAQQEREKVNLEKQNNQLIQKKQNELLHKQKLLEDLKKENSVKIELESRLMNNEIEKSNLKLAETQQNFNNQKNKLEENVEQEKERLLQQLSNIEINNDEEYNQRLQEINRKKEEKIKQTEAKGKEKLDAFLHEKNQIEKTIEVKQQEHNRLIEEKNEQLNKKQVDYDQLVHLNAEEIVVFDEKHRIAIQKEKENLMAIKQQIDIKNREHTSYNEQQLQAKKEEIVSYFGQINDLKLKIKAEVEQNNQLIQKNNEEKVTIKQQYDDEINKIQYDINRLEHEFIIEKNNLAATLEQYKEKIQNKRDIVIKEEKAFNNELLEFEQKCQLMITDSKREVEEKLNNNQSDFSILLENAQKEIDEELFLIEKKMEQEDGNYQAELNRLENKRIDLERQNARFFYLIQSEINQAEHKIINEQNNHLENLQQLEVAFDEEIDRLMDQQNALLQMSQEQDIFFQNKMRQVEVDFNVDKEKLDRQIYSLNQQLIDYQNNLKEELLNSDISFESAQGELKLKIQDLTLEKNRLIESLENTAKQRLENNNSYLQSMSELDNRQLEIKADFEHRTNEIYSKYDDTAKQVEEEYKKEYDVLLAEYTRKKEKLMSDNKQKNDEFLTYQTSIQEEIALKNKTYEQEIGEINQSFTEKYNVLTSQLNEKIADSEKEKQSHLDEINFKKAEYDKLVMDTKQEINELELSLALNKDKWLDLKDNLLNEREEMIKAKNEEISTIKISIHQFKVDHENTVVEVNKGHTVSLISLKNEIEQLVADVNEKAMEFKTQQTLCNQEKELFRVQSEERVLSLQQLKDNNLRLLSTESEKLNIKLEEIKAEYRNRLNSKKEEITYLLNTEEKNINEWIKLTTEKNRQLESLLLHRIESYELKKSETVSENEKQLANLELELQEISRIREENELSFNLLTTQQANKFAEAKRWSELQLNSKMQEIEGLNSSSKEELSQIKINYDIKLFETNEQLEALKVEKTKIEQDSVEYIQSLQHSFTNKVEQYDSMKTQYELEIKEHEQSIQTLHDERLLLREDFNKKIAMYREREQLANQELQQQLKIKEIDYSRATEEAELMYAEEVSKLEAEWNETIDSLRTTFAITQEELTNYQQEILNQSNEKQAAVEQELVDIDKQFNHKKEQLEEELNLLQQQEEQRQQQRLLKLEQDEMLFNNELEKFTIEINRRKESIEKIKMDNAAQKDAILMAKSEEIQTILSEKSQLEDTIRLLEADIHEQQQSLIKEQQVLINKQQDELNELDAIRQRKIEESNQLKKDLDSELIQLKERINDEEKRSEQTIDNYKKQREELQQELRAMSKQNEKMLSRKKADVEENYRVLQRQIDREIQLIRRDKRRLSEVHIANIAQLDELRNSTIAQKEEELNRQRQQIEEEKKRWEEELHNKLEAERLEEEKRAQLQEKELNRRKRWLKDIISEERQETQSIRETESSINETHQEALNLIEQDKKIHQTVIQKLKDQRRQQEIINERVLREQQEAFKPIIEEKKNDIEQYNQLKQQLIFNHQQDVIDQHEKLEQIKMDEAIEIAKIDVEKEAIREKVNELNQNYRSSMDKLKQQEELDRQIFNDRYDFLKDFFN